MTTDNEAFVSPAQNLARPSQADAMVTRRRARKFPSNAQRHGLTRLKGAVRGLGGRVIDRRTTLGKALAKWRQELIQDLGGTEAISTQERAIIDLAVRTRLLLDSVDVWLLTQPSLVNKRARALLPVVRERQQLADGLSRYLQMLGLERRQRPGLLLHEYLKGKGSAAVSTSQANGKPRVPAVGGAGQRDAGPVA